LTGARRNQIGSLKRKEIARNERQIVLQGPGRSKNGTKFILPLSTQALRLIEMVWDRRADKSGFLFGEGGDDAGGFSGWSSCTARFADNLGDLVDDYWLHDFRRTFQNIGQTKLKIPLLITEACMNHIAGEAKAGSKKHYNFAEYLDEKIEAMDKWGAFIDGVVRPKAKLHSVA
jgi:integrase